MNEFGSQHRGDVAEQRADADRHYGANAPPPARIVNELVGPVSILRFANDYAQEVTMRVSASLLSAIAAIAAALPTDPFVISISPGLALLILLALMLRD